ncbi:HD domain-containing protein [Rufibacter sp. LB8]|uniref:HD domain-containing protein n=1 Tax=Rufibacter sp. LB8 TaxID=2777781 RepID=UPI00178C6628|nr:HD domain-containing protein [Rufibacter sp. LB8]
MKQDALVQATAHHVEQLFSGEGSGHDWFHIKRVWQNAITIGQAENADLFIVQLGALLHDIADWKFHNGDEEAGPRAATVWLSSHGTPTPVIKQVCQIIKEVSYKGAGVATNPSSLEGRVVQDADRLDAIGAIGIARAFAYGGFKNREMYNPTQPPEVHATFEAYQKNQSATLNHFYEKLFLLKDRFTTATGRQLAEQRHVYMQEFVKEFLQEWHGAEDVPVAFVV